MKISKLARTILLILLVLMFLVLVALAIRHVLPWWSFVVVCGGAWFVFRSVKILAAPDTTTPSTRGTAPTSVAPASDEETDADGHRRVRERPKPTYYPLGIPPFVWALIGIVIFALLLIVYGLFTVKAEEWWIAVVAALLGGGIVTVISKVNKKKIVDAILYGLLFFGLCVGVWYTGVYWKPWLHWDSATHIGNRLTGKTELTTYQPVPAKKALGPNLIWGANDLKKGIRYYYDPTLSFSSRPANSAGIGAILSFYLEGSEDQVYWEQWFENMGQSVRHNNHEQDIWGRYYFIPDRDVKAVLY